jgi:hypothetical protein
MATNKSSSGGGGGGGGDERAVAVSGGCVHHETFDVMSARHAVNS